ncbi:MAG: hypothetical protein Q4D19_01245 [Lautropia sp.]|nr:hypothetical protein [Lautropia sp.]
MNQHDDVTAWQPAGDERAFEEWSLDQARESLKNPGKKTSLEQFIRERIREDEAFFAAERTSETAA